MRSRAAPPVSLSEFSCGALTVGLARSPAEMAAIQRLRAARFRGRASVTDSDRFDAGCQHLSIKAGAELVATARIRLLRQRAHMHDSYTAQFYDFSALFDGDKPILELGRLCVSRTRAHDPDVLRALLAGVARIVLAQDVGALIGCTSLKGADVGMHARALRYLADHHLGPALRQPKPRAADCFALPKPEATRSTAPQDLPPLLRMYLGLGGWVSDHAVRDAELDTLHVFTSVDVANIPPARQRVLIALAG